MRATYSFSVSAFSGSAEDSNKRQRDDLVFVVEVETGAFLQDAAELLPELDILIGLLRLHLFQ